MANCTKTFLQDHQATKKKDKVQEDKQPLHPTISNNKTSQKILLVLSQGDFKLTYMPIEG